MSGSHLDPGQLEAFLQGQIDETAALGIAAHLDDCWSCRQLVNRMDDLHQQLVASEVDGAMPDDLPDAIWQAHTTSATAGRWPVLGMAALAAAGLVMAMAGSEPGPGSGLASMEEGLSVAVADPMQSILPGAWISGLAAALLVMVWGVRTRR